MSSYLNHTQPNTHAHQTHTRSCVSVVLVDDLTMSSSPPNLVWTGCVYVCVCVCGWEQLVHCRMDLLQASLSSAKSLQPLIQELLRINTPSLCPSVPCIFFLSSCLGLSWYAVGFSIWCIFDDRACSHLSKLTLWDQRVPYQTGIPCGVGMSLKRRCTKVLLKYNSSNLQWAPR